MERRIGLRLIIPASLAVLTASSIGWSHAESESHIPRVVAQGRDIDLIAACILQTEVDSMGENVIVTQNPETGFTAYARWKGAPEAAKLYQQQTIDRMLSFDRDAGLTVDSTSLNVVNHISVGGPTQDDNLEATVVCPTRIPRVLG